MAGGGCWLSAMPWHREFVGGRGNSPCHGECPGTGIAATDPKADVSERYRKALRRQLGWRWNLSGRLARRLGWACTAKG